MRMGILYSLVALVAVVVVSAVDVHVDIAGVPLNAILGGILVVTVALGTKLLVTRQRGADRSNADAGVEREVTKRASKGSLRDVIVFIAVAVLLSLVTPLREWPPPVILSALLTIVSVDFWINYAVVKRGL